MKQVFVYFAFISYKREDEKWAKWLQDSLERYRLPAAISREAPNLPKRIRPIFRDKTDLGAGNLTQNLHKELEQSNYLLVISSPRSTNSEWVGKEIEAFIELRGADHIIPFIVEGTPNSNDANECFHPVIKDKVPEALGININEIGKQQALVKIIAKLLDLRFDALWNRHQRRQRQSRMMVAAASLLIISGIGYVWDYSRTKAEYYADYADKWGIPEGIIKLSDSQVSKRSSHYRFESSQRKLRRVVYANSAGKPKEHSDTEYRDRPAVMELTYAKNRLSSTELKTAQSKAIATYFWGGKNFDRIDIKADKEGESAASLAASFTSISANLITGNQPTKADIKRFKLTRNEQGYIIRREFKKHNGDDSIDARDAGGVWGFEYELDNLGRPKTMKYLGPHGEGYLSDKVGVVGRKYEYDKFGNTYKKTYFDKAEKPALNEQLWAICEDHAENNGNIVQRVYFDANGKPCQHRDGYAKLATKYDERGNVIEAAYWDKKDNPYLINDGYAKYTYKYDKQGRITEGAVFGVDGKPCLSSAGYSIFKYKYDKSGNIVETAFFGVNGKPCLHNDGMAKYTSKYDERGNTIEWAFFDIEGNPSPNAYGFAIHEKKYDEQGNDIESLYLDVDGMIRARIGGMARTTRKYDGQGNRIEWIYYDAKGNLVLNNWGIAKFTLKYDDRGNLVEEAYFGIDEKPCLHNNRYSKCIKKYDDRSNIIEWAYFGVDGKPIKNINGYARQIAEYDERGNAVEISCFGGEGRLVLHKDGYAKIVAKYDERGNRIEQAVFGVDGRRLTR